ncbi:hypothetical protein TSUD_381380 [Trifolium subterraneum]|uniref:Inosine/uridine-preferring nucleoside hydrolase domain-containing protein n=1 Tax=Trifolium subterraneum TaxID=3900 RepID=A0A2Z6LST8_TRISU|nr:hypothetical protein TSUD_381380 [Trifolium subterraneum]
MGGGVRSKNPTGCCPKNASSSCIPSKCGDIGNLFANFNADPYAEFNIFVDPFAAYQVIHSGIPVTLVPLDATNTIPTSEEFFDEFEKSQDTYEAQYCFKSLKMTRDTWVDNNFYTNSNRNNGENEFAEMEYMNITVITSNKPYGISDGSNPLFDGLKDSKFNLKKGGVHSGHIQQGLTDPFCFVKNGKGRCQDGYTKEVKGQDSVKVLVATKAKPNKDKKSSLDREYFKSFLNVLKQPQHTGRFNFTTQFPYYEKITYKPDFKNRILGKSVVFDMDMSAGDFLSLFYLLKVPVEVINLKAIIVSPTGWANAATIDVIYDLLHMMGRDDIKVGIGEFFAMNQSNPSFSSVGDCKYVKAIPNGNGGFLDSDTLFGLARDLPHSPRSSKTFQEVYVVGGQISRNGNDKGNVFSVPSNKYAEFNMFLDPLAAKTVFESEVNITLIPLSIQQKASSFSSALRWLGRTEKTPEAVFSKRLLSRLHRLKKMNHRYQHMDTFLGEILGAVVLANDHSSLDAKFESKSVKVLAEGDESTDGKMVVDEKHGKLVRVLRHVDAKTYHEIYAKRLGDPNQSAKVGSFKEQKRKWSQPHDRN